MSTIDTYAVIGMTCDHCTRAVRAEVSAIDGVSDVDVDLARDADAQVGGVEVGDLPDAVLGGVLTLEERGRADADWRDGTHSGYDDSSHRLVQGTRPMARGACRPLVGAVTA